MYIIYVQLCIIHFIATQTVCSYQFAPPPYRIIKTTALCVFHYSTPCTILQLYKKPYSQDSSEKGDVLWSLETRLIMISIHAQLQVHCKKAYVTPLEYITLQNIPPAVVCQGVCVASQHE